jgi:hypothetical protein
MAAPNLIASRRLSGSVRIRLQVVFARAWEALADTYHTQAVEFVRRLRGRLSLEEALERYFREMGVPAAMVDTVRARALIAMAELVEEEGEPELAEPTAWGALRPDQLFGAFRRRAQYVESTNLECRLAASLAQEAVAATHVRMALETAELLVAECTPDEALMRYIRTFNLPALDAQVIFRRSMALWAERDPLGLDRVEPVSAVGPAAAPARALPSPLALGRRITVGLRAIS